MKFNMLKNQEINVLSSSSRRETPAPLPDKYHHAKSVGCIPNVFHFFSGYQHCRRKFLTFGKKHGKVAHAKLLSVARREDHRSSTVLVAGWQDNVPAGDHLPTIEHHDSTHFEKKRKLMNEIEKCNKDLEELKGIIENHVRFTPNYYVGENMAEKRGNVNYDQQPSSVSVLDKWTRSPFSSTTYSSRRHVTNGQMATLVPQNQKPAARKKPGKDDVAFDSLFFSKLTTESLRAKREASHTPICSSKAMIDTVEQVCNDIVWGHKREMGRIGLAINDLICRDLIQELVKDCSSSCVITTAMYSLPLQACKRRLYS